MGVIHREAPPCGARPRATVSLLLIVRNEEPQLEACLAPVAALFDEIVIVDTGSVDGTKAVAARFTTRYLISPGAMIFRRLATSVCSGRAANM